MIPVIDRKQYAHNTINDLRDLVVDSLYCIINTGQPGVYALHPVVDAYSEQQDNRSTLLGTLGALDSDMERGRSEARDVRNKLGSLIAEAGGDRDIDAEQRICDVGLLPPSLTGMRSLSILGRGYQRPPHVSTFLASDSETRQADT
jgi:hypothetical protein